MKRLDKFQRLIIVGIVSASLRESDTGASGTGTEVLAPPPFSALNVSPGVAVATLLKLLIKINGGRP